ncbi:MAG: hypothetical protein FJX37_09500, partial [Alphaproteobacteria bacterium]|nr:hypothetical protein [Alphaproteobacteria bacterium]
FWAIGIWWIPMLFVLDVWRYLIRGVPFAYDPLYWGGVFPLGMFSVCTYHLAKVLDAPFLMPLSFAFMIIAAVAWGGNLHRVGRQPSQRDKGGVLRRSRPTQDAHPLSGPI